MLLGAVVVLTLFVVANISCAASAKSPKIRNISDEALVKELPGFKNQVAEVNGVKLHYVIGGSGEPLVLLPGWPETWWAYHKIMPTLAEHYTVISVDMRGMGASSMPQDGFDKRTMATDIHELAKKLGYTKINIAGHDIGSMVAYSYAANFPESTNKLVMMDVGHPSAGYLSIPMLPAKGTFGDKVDPAHPYLWWFSFHQVKGLPEQLLTGRIRLEQEWFYRYMLLDESAIDARDRAVNERAYNSSEAIRASDGWYQAFTQDVIDDGTYAKLEMPVLAIGAPGFDRLKATMSQKATNLTSIKVENSGHFIAEEQPDFVTKTMIDFLQMN